MLTSIYENFLSSVPASYEELASRITLSQSEMVNYFE